MAFDRSVGALFIAVRHVAARRLFRLDGPDLFGWARDQLWLFWTRRETRSVVVTARRLAFDLFARGHCLCIFGETETRRPFNFCRGSHFPERRLKSRSSACDLSYNLRLQMMPLLVLGVVPPHFVGVIKNVALNPDVSLAPHWKILRECALTAQSLKATDVILAHSNIMKPSNAWP
jgi:hypothetical protein